MKKTGLFLLLGALCVSHYALSHYGLRRGMICQAVMTSCRFLISQLLLGGNW